jgi:threonine/homoserine/homoserine lactone efflux protein
MEVITDFYLFMLSVVVISLSGVMSPGPLFAVTIAKASRDKKVGPLISLGHGVVEFPLMFLIYFGFNWLFSLATVQKTISIFGGFIMIYMAVQMLRSRRRNAEESQLSGHGPMVSAILATAANPYFILWWATIGAALVTNAALFGLIGFLIFAVTHWSCDLLWNTFVSIMIFKSKRFWTPRVRSIIFSFCFLTLTGFGAWFIISTAL